VAEIPRSGFDSTLALKRDPYGFIAEGCRRLHSDVFRTRLLLRPTICMMGRDAAALFYDEARFVRSAAAPVALRKTLFGRGGVQSLDGAAHRHRKQLFLELTSTVEAERLAAVTDAYWRSARARWRAQGRVVLYDALHEVLTGAVCDWAGVPLEPRETPTRARDLAALFDLAGSALGQLRARRARARSEAWAAEWIERIRAAGAQQLDRPALRIASHRDADGALLPARIAAVELLNLMRPTVATSVYVVFAAHALHFDPAARDALRGGSDAFAECFVQEVRRFYPFFPAVAALVREDFRWGGFDFLAGTRTLLDLYGTNHDARIWKDPEVFRPERFLERAAGPFELVPQGGGEPLGHRCPGEAIVLALLRVALDFFVRRMEYTMPAQDLEIDRTRLPALPRSRFVISDVRATAA
jgi:fatty-acid peroxygenase